MIDKEDFVKVIVHKDYSTTFFTKRKLSLLPQIFEKTGKTRN